MWFSERADVVSDNTTVTAATDTTQQLQQSSSRGSCRLAVFGLGSSIFTGSYLQLTYPHGCVGGVETDNVLVVKQVTIITLFGPVLRKNVDATMKLHVMSHPCAVRSPWTTT